MNLDYIREKYKKKFFYALIFFIFFIGVFLRFRLFLYNPDLHRDECVLALNLINKNYFEFFLPLDSLQIASPMFLVLSKFIYNIVNIHYTAFFSDMVLRVVPFFCGIASLPLFYYVLNKTFHLKYLSLLGTLLLAINRFSVGYSVVFKQYEMELLVTLVIIAITLSINLKCISYKNLFIKTLVLAMCPYFSISSIFLIPAFCTYIICKNFKLERLKKILVFLLIIIFSSLIFLFFFILPIYNTHYQGMYEYWNSKVFKILQNFKFFISFLICVLLFAKFNYKKALLFTIPVLLLFFAHIYKSYPLDYRLLLFAFPLIITIFISPLIYLKNKYRNMIIFCIICICLFRSIIKSHNIEAYIYKRDYSRVAWNYLIENYDFYTPILFCGSTNANKYYSKFYNNGYINYKKSLTKKNANKFYNKLKSGKYYIIGTGYFPHNVIFVNYLESSAKILQSKKTYDKNNHLIWFVIKFQK